MDNPALPSLPDPPEPVGRYLAATRWNGFLFVSGQLPFERGVLGWRGAVGDDLDVEEGRAAARTAARNLAARIVAALGGADRVLGIARLDGHVRVAPGFENIAGVLDAASEELVRVFGERGRHARAAFGQAQLPGGAAVELSAIVAVAD